MSKSRPDVLLLEDDAEHAALVGELLQRSFQSVRLRQCDSVRDAVQALRAECFDAVVADLSLPDSKGVETVETLHSVAPSTPVIVLTGDADERTAIRAVQAGAEDYLLKEELTGRSLWRSIRYSLERHQAKERLAQLAHYDSLTCLLNRSSFGEHLTRAVRRARRRAGRLVLMFIDLDRFKEVNDTFGHRVGDALLIEVAQRLEQSVRESDVVARLGGDEFAVILEEIVDDSEAMKVVERIYATLAPPPIIDEHEIELRASIGITTASADDTAEQMIQRADAAMYQAKESGRNKYRFFDHALHAKQRRRRRSERELRVAVDRMDFELYYQPQQSTHDGRLVGVEALLRWKHAEQGMVAPRSFVRLLEEQRLILPVGEWVLQQACKKARDWQAQRRGFRMAVNVSPVQFEDPNFVKRLQTICSEEGVAPATIQLELTEDALMSDTSQSRQTLQELTELGVTIAIDDFGTGYSSLAYLRKFPVGVLKIDKAFISSGGSDSIDVPIVSAVVSLGQCMNCQTIAEGVETEEQFQVVKRLGCDVFQGYYTAHPLSESEFEAWLDKNA